MTELFERGRRRGGHGGGAFSGDKTLGYREDAVPGRRRMKYKGGPEVNVRQANGSSEVHVARPQMKETYCGRAVDEEEWLITFREATCTACAQARAYMPERAERR